MEEKKKPSPWLKWAFYKPKALKKNYNSKQVNRLSNGHFAREHLLPGQGWRSEEHLGSAAGQNSRADDEWAPHLWMHST